MRQMLPIEVALPGVASELAGAGRAVLSAEPGAGKTTRVPLFLLDEPWMAGKRILMLEPRRLAARRAAEYMASMRDEPVGRTVGYRIRGEQQVSAATRLEIITEGILTRLLHEAPDLPGVGLLIFDEFHERSLHADLGLAFAIDVRKHLRTDLRLLVMSATLDQLGVAGLLDGAPIVQCPGRVHPVETVYASTAAGFDERLVAATVRRALRECTGDILVFLPGQREIRRTMTMLLDEPLPPSVGVHPLFGDAPVEEQQAALRRDGGGNRKVILSTSIAETSLTIPGVAVVIDSGLSRLSKFDPRRGMEGLITVPVSRASADQRRGRAGREQPGVCYRLWTEEQHTSLPEFTTPEIESADLARFALDLAQWGDPTGAGLAFLNRPPEAHLLRARRLLQQLGLVLDNGDITAHGKAVAALPVHPRLGHMIVKGQEMGQGPLACDLAALLEERDMFRGRREADIDLAARLDALRTGAQVESFQRERILREAHRLRTMMHIGPATAASVLPGVLVALAYPDRVARRRTEDGNRFLTADGTGAVVPEWSALAHEEFLAIAEVDGVGREARVFLAAALPAQDLATVLASEIVEKTEVQWDAVEQAAIARRVRRLGGMVIDESPVVIPPEALANVMVEGVRSLGLNALPWDRESIAFRERSEWVRHNNLVPPPWPRLDDAALLADITTWLTPFVGGMSRREHLARLAILEILKSLFTYQQLRELDRLAPPTVKAPAGSLIHIDYSGAKPTFAVKLQEMLGQTESPMIGGGTYPLLIHLLSPAGRPLAVTQDLPNFWKEVYPSVRKEMRGRYPKHYWPEDPLTAKPTRNTRKHIKD